MDVYIDKSVHSKIIRFYEAAMRNHITLDENTINRKIDRVYKGYREYIFENLHFAYQIYERKDGTRIVRVHDICHSLLYK